MLEHFELSDGEKHHPLWARLKAHFETQLERLHVRNERQQTDLETATIRGEIKLLRRIIALGDDRPNTTG